MVSKLKYRAKGNSQRTGKKQKDSYTWSAKLLTIKYFFSQIIIWFCVKLSGITKSDLTFIDISSLA